MLLLAAVDWLHYMFMIPLTLLSVFLILVILVQRGRGGGLAGALGGMGGQSAFGTKAGDTFTRITIGVAAVWILLSVAYIRASGPVGGSKLSGSGLGGAAQEADAGSGDAADAMSGGAADENGDAGGADDAGGGEPSGDAPAEAE